MRAGFSTPTRSEAQKLDLFMKPSMADRDLFQGVTKDWASLATLRASLNSPRSRISLNSLVGAGGGDRGRRLAAAGIDVKHLERDGV